ncbi:hypothetical protein CR513_38152, partial [Mucuna pruriens]
MPFRTFQLPPILNWWNCTLLAHQCVLDYYESLNWREIDLFLNKNSMQGTGFNSNNFFPLDIKTFSIANGDFGEKIVSCQFEYNCSKKFDGHHHLPKLTSKDPICRILEFITNGGYPLIIQRVELVQILPHNIKETGTYTIRQVINRAFDERSHNATSISLPHSFNLFSYQEPTSSSQDLILHYEVPIIFMKLLEDPQATMNMTSTIKSFSHIFLDCIRFKKLLKLNKKGGANLLQLKIITLKFTLELFSIN